MDIAILGFIMGVCMAIGGAVGYNSDVYHSKAEIAVGIFIGGFIGLALCMVIVFCFALVGGI